MKTEDLSNSSLLRREFKIPLTFVSLTHQTDSGLKRGYKETEIVDAVIRAIYLHAKQFKKLSISAKTEKFPSCSLS